MRRIGQTGLAGLTLVVALTLLAAPADGQTRRVSVATGGAETGGGGDAKISPDGRFVVFDSSAADLVSGDLNLAQDVFVHDRVTGQTTRVSVATGGGEADGASDEASISRGGRYVAFESQATNLVGADANLATDIFVHDWLTGATIRVSVATGGGEANGGSRDGRISADGRFVAFRSGANNLVAGDGNGVDDIFVRDRDVDADGIFDEPGQTSTVRVSVSTAGAEAGARSREVMMSATGRFVAFESTATNLASPAPNGAAARNIYLRDRDADSDGVFDESGPGEVSTVQVNVTSGGSPGDGEANGVAISADGRYLSFESAAANLFPGDVVGSDIVVHDRVTGQNAKVNKASDGTPGAGGSLAESWLSGDGRFVVFSSSEPNLVAGDLNLAFDVFLHDSGDVDADDLFDEPGQVSTTRVSVSTGGVEGDSDSDEPTIAEDGSVVVFESRAGNLVLDDLNLQNDVFSTAGAANVVQNGAFDSGAAGWPQFATPDMTYIVSKVTGGVFEFYRAPPPGTQPGRRLPADGRSPRRRRAVLAQFDLGNTSSVRKRISVLVHDSDFSDLSVCTFWLPAERAAARPTACARTRPRRGRTRRSRSTPPAPAVTAGSTSSTTCRCRHGPGRVGRPRPSASTRRRPRRRAARRRRTSRQRRLRHRHAGAVGTFGQITSQVASGVFEFMRLPGAPAGVVLQPTGQAIAANEILTATFELGNSSGVRKRVTVILHDNDFTRPVGVHLLAPAGPAAVAYTDRTFATKAWTNATLSVYPATVAPTSGSGSTTSRSAHAGRPPSSAPSASSRLPRLRRPLRRRFARQRPAHRLP